MRARTRAAEIAERQHDEQMATEAARSAANLHDLIELAPDAFFLADRNEHVAEFGQLRLVADGTMAWNDDRFVRDSGDVCLGCANHSVDAAAR